MALNHRQVGRSDMPMWRDSECSPLEKMSASGRREREEHRGMLERQGVVRGSSGFPRVIVYNHFSL